MFDFLDKTGLKTVLEQIKAKFPSSLPANGGNADYATNAGNANAVGGIQISDIRQITRNAIQTLPTPPIAECDYFVSNADSTFPYYFGNLSIRYGSYTAEFVAIYQTTGDDKSIWYNLYLGGWVGWKEISTTPIKSTTGTYAIDAWGGVTLWFVGQVGTPIFAYSKGYYAPITPHIGGNDMNLWRLIFSESSVFNTSREITIIYF